MRLILCDHERQWAETKLIETLNDGFVDRCGFSGHQIVDMGDSATCVERFRNSVKELDNGEQISAICHLGPSRTIDLKESEARKGWIIYVSSDGRSDPHDEKHGLCHVFLRQSTREMEDHDWKIVLNEIRRSRVAENIVGKKCPANLVMYFDPPVAQYLPALAIMCQGYLCVGEFLGKERAPEGPIVGALKKMGWTDLSQDDKDMVRSRLTRRNPKQVPGRGWWKQIIPKKKKDIEDVKIFLTSIERELDGCKGLDEMHRRAIEALVGYIVNEQPDPDVELAGEKVAEAYLSINEVLARYVY